MRPRALALLAIAGVACASPAPVPFPHPFHVIAHRGASAYAPENTLAAFDRALALGAFEVELDVQRSADGEIVLFHDGSLDGKTDLRGRVRDHDAATLLRADIGSWFDARHPELPERFAGTSLTTLPELFERFGRALHYHVEIKSDEAELVHGVLAAIEAHGLGDRVTVTSFRDDQLDRVRRASPEIPITLLLRAPTRGGIDDAAARGFTGVGIAAGPISPGLVRHAHEQGLEVRGFGVKSDADMERVIRAGANGMTTNWPDRLIERLVAHRGGTDG